ncbi:MAG: helix-turn-helix transcriptional regulator [Thermodesulfobacteriota bacterium]|nr:helix-turn-helix transcriptional regulator [Thermodesulfobacteriota bacterium]
MGSIMLERNLELLKRLAKGIVSVFGDRCEVVIHDFGDVTQSLVHMEGNVTNRTIGAPVTDLVYRLVNEFGDQVPDKIGYKSTTDTGRVLKCSTIFVRDDNGKPEGCICLNFDVTDFIFLSTAFSELNPLSDENSNRRHKEERFSKSFPETMESVIDSTLSKHRKMPAMMDKAEKKQLIRRLDKAGVFLMKGSVKYLAKVCGVSQYTIYNYLKEVRET